MPVNQPGNALCACCGRSFNARRAWHRFCSRTCRMANHEAKGDTLRAVVSSVRIMRRGAVSVVIRFGLEDRDRALKLEPGKVVEIDAP